MSAFLAYLPPDPVTPPRLRRAVALAVAVAHGLLVVALWRGGAPAAPAPVPVVQVSFLAAPVPAVAPAPPAPPVPPPPARPREQAPLLSTPRQVAAEAAPAPPVEPRVAAEPAEAPALPAAPAATAPAEPAPPAAATVPPSFHAAYLRNPRPAYPLMSRRLGEQGITYLRVQVGADGRTQQVTVGRSSGHERLDRAALEAVRDWRFVPAREGDKAVAGWVTVPISWKLEN